MDFTVQLNLAKNVLQRNLKSEKPLTMDFRRKILHSAGRERTKGDIKFCGRSYTQVYVWIFSLFLLPPEVTQTCFHYN